MYIETKILRAVNEAINKKDYKEHLKNTCFSFDEEKNVLHIVGTDAQLMIIAEVEIRAEYKDFCKKFFSNNEAYLIPDSLLKTKSVYISFEELNDKLVADGMILEKSDVRYPNWKAVIPRVNLEEQTKYVAFKPEYIKKINSAFGYKSGVVGVEGIVPICNSGETLTPHLWKQNNLTAILMPVRID